MHLPDPFDGALERPEQLREFYDAPMAVAVRKDIGHIDELCRRLIAAAPMLFVATFSSEGHADVSPRGGQPGFVTVLDDQHLADRSPAARPAVPTPRALPLLADVPWLWRPKRRKRQALKGGAIGVSGLYDRKVREPPQKAFVRSTLWDPDSWPDPADLPSSAEVSLAHQRNPELTLEQVQQREREALAKRLD